MRATYHSGRKGKNGRFNPNHCDRNFNLDSEFAEHIEKPLTANNVYMIHEIGGGFRKKKVTETFEELERQFYADNFAESLQQTNERYIRNRNKSRCKTMEQFYESQQTCPEESILTIGNSIDGAPNPELMRRIIIDQMMWERKTFPNAVILNMAFHADEPDANYHLHMRRTYCYIDEEGVKHCNQKQALLQMGLERPRPDLPESRTNNVKVTHTRLCREHLLGLCEKYGLEMEKEPRIGGKELTTLKRETAEKLEALKAELEKVNQGNLVSEITEYAQMLTQKGEAELQKTIQKHIECLQSRFNEKGIMGKYLSQKGLLGEYQEFRKAYIEHASQIASQEIQEITKAPETIQAIQNIIRR